MLLSLSEGSGVNLELEHNQAVRVITTIFTIKEIDLDLLMIPLQRYFLGIIRYRC